MGQSNPISVYKPKNHIRVVTATALFDGHDAAINIMRRILQATGVEVIHLGHNRSVDEIVKAAIEEDVQAVAISSYQGGHVEFFKYMVDLLAEQDAGHVKVFGGGGGVIIPDEITELEAYGVAKIYAPEDGARMGLQGIINHMVESIDVDRSAGASPDLFALSPENKRLVARLISAVEAAREDGRQAAAALVEKIRTKAGQNHVPVIGITGTGGAGKSSLTDELVVRLRHDHPDLDLAIICCDPSRRKTGGALLGDRIRMNAIDSPRVYMRSMATRSSHTELSKAMRDAIDVAKAAGFGLVIAETAGIGQGDSQIVDLCDVSIYLMTSDFGAASQLEKIDMLDFADLVVVNKYEKQGSEDAVRDVRKQVQRNRNLFELPAEKMPVFGTIASKFNDDGVTALYHAVIERVTEKTGTQLDSKLPGGDSPLSSSKTIIIPPERTRYLSEISDAVRRYHRDTEAQAQAVRKRWHLAESVAALEGNGEDVTALTARLRSEIERGQREIETETGLLLDEWDTIKAQYQQDEMVYSVRDREVRAPLKFESLARSKIPKVALPQFSDPGELYRWLRRENLPGYFPYTAGVYPLRRIDEEPTRMFAGEGDPARTNRRFKLLSADYKAKRLSTAFDSVTLYGWDPDERPDIYGKVGTSGVSICTLDDMKVLYDGFALCSP